MANVNAKQAQAQGQGQSHGQHEAALSAKEHKELVQSNLQNEQMRENLSSAMHLLQKNRHDLIERKFIDWEGLREHAKCVKNNALMSLKERGLEFERNATYDGIKVHYASTAEDACAIVLELARRNGVDRILKGKSMVSEEIGLNSYLQSHGIDAEESDLGELILQLSGDAPVHIVVPAIHRNRFEVGEIFNDKLHVPKSDDIPTLNAIARDHLRPEFAKLKMGLSGVNFGISSAGAIWLMENEGNGRMCTTAPDIHVALCGIEKIVESFADAAALIHLLTPSATGQFIPAYNNIITGPRREAEGELDGPHEVHVILLDHQRSFMLQDKNFYEALRCIRCGCCMNFCPVFDKIGGHSYHSAYPGPIGEVISPNLFGIDTKGDILDFCSQCGRCSEVCPEKIPLAKLIRVLRSYRAKAPLEPVADAGAAAGTGAGTAGTAGASGATSATIKGYDAQQGNLAKDTVIRLFTKAATSPRLWNLAVRNAHYTNGMMQMMGPHLPIIGSWAAYKSLPQMKTDIYSGLAKVPGVKIVD